jgi:hypothetical protein
MMFTLPATVYARLTARGAMEMRVAPDLATGEYAALAFFYQVKCIFFVKDAAP